jgi:hypothetical protein
MGDITEQGNRGGYRTFDTIVYDNPLEHQLPLVSLLQSTRIQHCSGPMIAVPIEEQLHVLKKQPLHRAVMYLLVYCDITPSIWLVFNSLLRGLVHERSGEKYSPCIASMAGHKISHS